MVETLVLLVPRITSIRAESPACCVDLLERDFCGEMTSGSDAPAVLVIA